MRKHNCPYLNKGKECTNKNRNYGSHKKLFNCPFNNEKKCRWYNEWFKKKTSLREDERELLELIKQGAKI